MIATQAGVQFSMFSEEIKNSKEKGRWCLSRHGSYSPVVLVAWGSLLPPIWMDNHCLCARAVCSNTWAQQCFHGEHGRDLFLGVPWREHCLGSINLLRSSVIRTSHNTADLLWPIVAGCWLNLKNFIHLPASAVTSV